jgi:hypothetical protein
MQFGEPRSLCVKLEGQGLIYNYNPKIEDLIAKSKKHLDCGLIGTKVRGLFAR